MGKIEINKNSKLSYLILYNDVYLQKQCENKIVISLTQQNQTLLLYEKIRFLIDLKKFHKIFLEKVQQHPTLIIKK